MSHSLHSKNEGTQKGGGTTGAAPVNAVWMFHFLLGGSGLWQVMNDRKTSISHLFLEHFFGFFFFVNVWTSHGQRKAGSTGSPFLKASRISCIAKKCQWILFHFWWNICVAKIRPSKWPSRSSTKQVEVRWKPCLLASQVAFSRLFHAVSFVWLTKIVLKSVARNYSRNWLEQISSIWAYRRKYTRPGNASNEVTFTKCQQIWRFFQFFPMVFAKLQSFLIKSRYIWKFLVDKFVLDRDTIFRRPVHGASDRSDGHGFPIQKSCVLFVPFVLFLRTNNVKHVPLVPLCPDLRRLCHLYSFYG